MNNLPSDDNAASAGSATNPPPDGKNPLDALEELLNQAKQGSGNIDAATAEAGQQEQEAEQQAAAQAQAEAEYQQMAAQSQQVDSDLLAKQREALEEIKTTHEYQARVEQMEEIEEEKAKELDKQDGFGIQQLKRKKI